MEIQTNQFTQEMPVISDSNNIKERLQHNSPTTAEIEAWLVSYLGDLLEINPREVDMTISFERYGLDSAAAMGIVGDLEEWLGYELEATLVYDYPNIEALAQYLSK